ncbi:glycosyltransferase family 2 protein [Aureisphaera sp. CAU 1614]|uniref:Glycosyltransferase family 2 protein n=1 Tax=Halomarinibacterium sedimenti TaxID=2857106 RepID=A0A9X1JX46_9FLAO|nr:glycosyltransferase [Halomarinibacterium sedimenti]MBW2937728.1 glycosyltransferase family 2 protein [Halomarinibacterium sedimenti]
MNKDGVSVVVCCYNSEAIIRNTMEHLYAQHKANDVSVEIILVDNNSSDRTVAVAEEVAKTQNNKFPLRVVTEKEQGLSFARIRGIYESQYDYVLFCDDDNWLEENYITTAYSILSSNDEIGVLGGRGDAVSNISLPYWFYSYNNYYAVGVQDLFSGDVSYKGYVWGAGFMIKKQIAIQFLNNGFSFYCTGRKGDDLLAGEDAEICKWYLLAGKKLWYDESLRFKHFIPEKRLTKTYFKSLEKGINASLPLLAIYNDVISDIKATSKMKKRVFIKLIFDIFWSKLFYRADLYKLRYKLQRAYPRNKKLVVNTMYYDIFNAYLSLTKK